VTRQALNHDMSDYQVLRLRPAQRDVHRAQVVHGESRLANIGAVVDVRGGFDVDAFFKGEARVRLSSDALRSGLAIIDGEAVQIVHRAVGLERQIVDVSSSADPLAAAAEWAEGHFARPFVDDGLQIASHHAVIRLGHDHHWIYGKYNHALFDGWATSLVHARLCAAYNSVVGGAEPCFEPEMAAQEIWQNDAAYAGSDRWQADRKYWMGTLSNYRGDLLSPPCNLTSERHVLRLTQSQTAGLRRWCEAEKLTAMHFFAGVLQTSLFRMAAFRDVTVGVPVLNRRTAVEKRTIALFLGFCVLRTRISPDWTFNHLCREIGSQLKTNYRHQRFPLETLIDEVGRLPYEVSLSYERHDYSASYRGTETAVTPLRSPVQDYALKVFVRDFDDGRPIFVDFDANRSCFRDFEPERLVETFGDVVAQVLRYPAVPIRPPQQSRTVGPSALVLPSGPSDLWSAFGRVALRHGDRVAVEGSGGSLSYAALSARAAAVADALRGLGAGAETRVGLCGGRDAGFVVGMLGILGAGAAYVPLDPAYPAERLAFLLADSGVAALVGREHDLDALPAAGLPRLAVDAQGRLAPVASSEPARQRPISRDQAAYVIYTSGSTGTPKGCVVTHSNVLRLFDVTAEPFSLDQQDRWSVFHSTAFDFSVWELWGALLHGGTAVFVPFETSRDPDAFAGFLQSHRISVLSQTPSAFRLLAAQDTTLPDLRLVVLGGEALASDTLSGWFARHGAMRPQLVNMYGITETTVHVTARMLSTDDAGGQHTCPIGQPLADLSLQILDPYGDPVPDGIAGEIHVGGPGVARGYLNQPGLTATRFLPDPDGPPGARRYRAGDRARRHANGEVDTLGRNDAQLKIRGFRIEPGEIETQIRRHPGVRDAAVIPDPASPDEPRLIAYVAGTNTPGEPVAGLREALVAALPPHMVPAHIVTLGALPLTRNGKLDHAALPAPSTQQTDRTPPETPTEIQIAAIWADVLKINPGRNDSFYALGGDSILALKVVNMARETTGLNLSLQMIFTAPTLRSFAAGVDEIAAAPGDADGSGTSPGIRRAARRPTRVFVEQVDGFDVAIRHEGR
jgi:amino acid adenylation domain-containing protein